MRGYEVLITHSALKNFQLEVVSRIPAVSLCDKQRPAAEFSKQFFRSDLR
jgi:hypothetical protein